MLNVGVMENLFDWHTTQHGKHKKTATVLLSFVFCSQSVCVITHSKMELLSSQSELFNLTLPPHHHDFSTPVAAGTLVALSYLRLGHWSEVRVSINLTY